MFKPQEKYCEFSKNLKQIISMESQRATIPAFDISILIPKCFVDGHTYNSEDTTDNRCETNYDQRILHRTDTNRSPDSAKQQPM
jgi:hypothetical protein